MENQIQKKKIPLNKRTLLIIAICGVLLLAGTILTIVLISGKDTIDIKTSYMTMQFPKEYAKDLAHKEETEGNVTSEIFSFAYNGSETELFRLRFGAEPVENVLGYLHTDTGVIPITLVVADYMSVDFEEDIAHERYLAMMGSLDTVLASIFADRQFSESMAAPVGKAEKVKLTYFTVPLPAAVTCKESTQADIYKADFYANVEGQQILLYTITLGDTQAESPIGMVNGKALSVVPAQLGSLEKLQEDSRTTVYQLMETVNDVLDAIRADKSFAEFSIPEG